MGAHALVAEKWLACALASYGNKIAEHALANNDPYRNPIRHILQTNMTTLVSELFGGMDTPTIDKAFADIVAVRAVQGLTVVQALGFVFRLRDIVRAELPDADFVKLDERIDQFSLAAFAQFLACRERLSELRLNERLRAFGGPPLRRRDSKLPHRADGQ
jgi:hypothetical protein